MSAATDDAGTPVSRGSTSRSGGAPEGPLAGRTLLVKDLIDTAGIRTTYGSRIYADHVPTRNATVVQRALDAGATILGKANLVEFAWGVMGTNPWYGTVRNPVRPGLTTGGSSSGNAAAIAGGLCDLGIGTDTGCSVRLPAAACELVGLKPRLGVVPEEGVFPLCPSFDTVGPMGRSVGEVTTLWSVLAGRAAPEPRLDGLVVGLLRQAPNLADGRETEASDAAEEWVPPPRGARRSGRRSDDPRARSRTRGPCSSTRPPVLTPPPSLAAPTSTATAIRAKLDSGQRVDRDAVTTATARSSRGASSSLTSTSTSARASRSTGRRRMRDELEVRLPLSSFLRWVNLLGWAALAIGNLQLVAPLDETVLAAGLAWERG